MLCKHTHTQKSQVWAIAAAWVSACATFGLNTPQHTHTAQTKIRKRQQNHFTLTHCFCFLPQICYLYAIWAYTSSNTIKPILSTEIWKITSAFITAQRTDCMSVCVCVCKEKTSDHSCALGRNCASRLSARQPGCVCLAWQRDVSLNCPPCALL